MGLAFKHHDEVVNWQKSEAARASAIASHEALFNLLLTDLACKREAISAAPQGKTRNELKQRYLNEVTVEVEKYIESGVAFANPVLIWAMIWNFDLGHMENGMRLAEIALEQKQDMPHPPFKSTFKLDAYLADAVFDNSERAFKDERSAEPCFSETFARVLDGTFFVHDIVKAKYCKLAALMLEKSGEFERALSMAGNAFRFGGEKAQVKTLTARLEKAVAAKVEAERYKR